MHRLAWRDGLDCEYKIAIDGAAHPVPPAMVARASSSWKVNDLANWVHAWDEGDGNPLHRGLRTEQKLCIGGVTYALRYWRALYRPNEMRINVEVTYADTGKYAVHTQRFFHKIDVDRVYAAACVPKFDMTAMRGAVTCLVERFDRRGTEPFEPFEPFELFEPFQFFQNRNVSL